MDIIRNIKNATNIVKADHAALLMKKLDLVPVIFANGEDNDVPGLVAAANNQRVLFKDKIYDPDESILFDYEVFGIRSNVLLISSSGPNEMITDMLVLHDTFKCRRGLGALTFNCCKYNRLSVARM